MPQAKLANSIAAAVPSTGNGAAVSRLVRLDDYRQPRPARDLADAQRQLARFLPDMPNTEAMAEVDAFLATVEWQRACTRIYALVVGGKRGKWSAAA